MDVGELTVEEQRQAEADLNLGMRLAIDERDLGDRERLQKRASEIARDIANSRIQRQVDAVSAKARSAEVFTKARADEARAEAAGAPLTPGDDVAKAAAAAQAAEAEVDDQRRENAAKAEAENTIAAEGPDQGEPGTRADRTRRPSSRAKSDEDK